MTRQKSFGICSVGSFIFVLVEVIDALLCCDNLILIYILSVNFSTSVFILKDVKIGLIR